MKRIRPRSTDCLCEWPRDCGGSGILQCEGCGGDQCVCLCGGEMCCNGCIECDEQDTLVVTEESLP